MINLLRSGFIFMLVLSGCGWDGTPTRHNDFIPPTSIEIVADNSVIAAKTSTKLSVKGNYTGYSLDITDQAVWSNDSPAVAGLLASASPRAIGFKPGKANLTATVKGVSTTFSLTVSSATIATLAVTPAAPSIAKGLSTQFIAKGTFSDATVQDLTYDAAWASSASSVATVSDVAGSKGLANAKAEGTSNINATFDGVNGSTLLTVTAPLPLSVGIAPVSATLTVATSKNFTVSASLSDGTILDVTTSSEWTSSTIATATVGNTAADKGLVKAVAVGTTSITAVYGGLTSAPATVTVVAKTLESLALNHTGTFPFISTAPVAFTATANYTDGTNQDVSSLTTWTMSTTNPVVASVDATGQVTPGARGSATLTASYGGKIQTVTISVP